MSERSPFLWVKPASMGRMFIVIFVITLVLMVSLQVLGSPLRNEVATGGIISYEFSGDFQTAQAILASWGDDGRVFAGLQLGLDYLFMPAYALAIGLACVLVSNSYMLALQRWGAWLAWGLWAAAGLDGLENYALIRLLIGSTNPIWPSVAYWSAAIKFAWVALGLMYVLIGAILMLLGRFKRLENV